METATPHDAFVLCPAAARAVRGECENLRSARRRGCDCARARSWRRCRVAARRARIGGVCASASAPTDGGDASEAADAAYGASAGGDFGGGESGGADDAAERRRQIRSEWGNWEVELPGDMHQTDDYELVTEDDDDDGVWPDDVPIVNSLALVGRVGGKPEVRITASGKVARFSIALQREYPSPDGTDWFNVVCFKYDAEFVERFVDRGLRVGVEGQLNFNTFVSRNSGETVSAVDICASNVRILQSRSEPSEAMPPESDEVGAYSMGASMAPPPPSPPPPPAPPPPAGAAASKASSGGGVSDSGWRSSPYNSAPATSPPFPPSAPPSPPPGAASYARDDGSFSSLSPEKQEQHNAWLGASRGGGDGGGDGRGSSTPDTAAASSPSPSFSQNDRPQSTAASYFSPPKPAASDSPDAAPSPSSTEERGTQAAAQFANGGRQGRLPRRMGFAGVKHMSMWSNSAGDDDDDADDDDDDDDVVRFDNVPPKAGGADSATQRSGGGGSSAYRTSPPPDWRNDELPRSSPF